MTKRVDCPVCKGLTEIKEGILLHHRAMPGVGPVCKGSGEPPEHLLKEKK